MKGQLFRKVVNTVEKHSPTILVVLGVGGVVAGTVMACKATPEAKEVVEKAQYEIENIEAETEKALNGYGKKKKVSPEELEKEKNKETLSVYFKTGKKLVKIYGPATLVMGISISAIIWSNRILTKRNVALGAAYATLDACFKDYRKQIVEKYGEDADIEARYNVKVKKKKDGTKEYIASEKTVYPGYSEYAKIFDELSLEWKPDAEYNKMFLLSVQEACNQKLRSHGKLFLNEVYDALGLPETKAGQVVGWIYDEENDKGDNFIQFLDLSDPSKKLFIDGYEKSVLLDFNVDGCIWDKLVW